MIALLATCAVLFGATVLGADVSSRLKSDAQTDLLLEVRAGRLADVSRKADPAAMKTVGVSAAKDAAFGEIFRFGDEPGRVCDVLAPDPYCRGAMPLRFVYDMTCASRREVDGLKPVVTVIGSYGTMRADLDEMRTMCYLAVAGGATGLAFYSWDEGDVPNSEGDTAQMPEQVELYRKLLAELNALKPALTVPNVADGPRVEPATPRGVFPFAKRGRDGKTYVVVCSDLYRTTEKRLAWKAAAGKTARLVYGPDRGGASPRLVFDAAGKASVKLPPLGSAVYTY